MLHSFLHFSLHFQSEWRKKKVQFHSKQMKVNVVIGYTVRIVIVKKKKTFNPTVTIINSGTKQKLWLPLFPIVTYIRVKLVLK